MNASQQGASSLHGVDAQAVLDRTRRELRDFLLGEPVASINRKSPNQENVAEPSRYTRRNGATTTSRKVNGIDWLGLMKVGVAAWWRDHPLHVGAALLEPVVADYVRRKPVATLATAAAAGAVFVLIRPWRIASVTALGMSLVRSSNLPVMAASLVATAAENLRKEQS